MATALAVAERCSSSHEVGHEDVEHLGLGVVEDDSESQKLVFFFRRKSVLPPDDVDGVSIEINVE